MNNKITFPRLATLLADSSGRSKRFSEDFLREFFSLISETLEAQESVKVKGLGTFRLSRVEPRRSVDVTTGEPMEISGHTKVVFTPAKELADAVNAPFEAFTAIEISDDADIEQLFPPEEIQLQFSSEDISSDQDFEGDSPTILKFEHPLKSRIEEESTAIIQQELEQEQEVKPGNGPEPPEPSQQPISIIDIHSKASTGSESKPEVKFQQAPSGYATDEEEVQEAKNEKDSISTPEEEFKVNEAPSSDSTEESLETVIDTAEEKDSKASKETADEIEEEEEEFEAENSRRKTWVRSLMIVFGAAVVALFVTFIIWYVFATHDFNRVFNRSTTTAEAGETAGFVVGKKASTSEVSIQDASIAIDTLSDSVQENELEEDVPTAPSDALVYDTISTTRYLTTMAKAHYGNYNLWPYIYQENQSILGHPDRIRPGTPVVIPKLSKYGIDPNNSNDVEKAKKLGVEIYARYGKKI